MVYKILLLCCCLFLAKPVSAHANDYIKTKERLIGLWEMVEPVAEEKGEEVYFYFTKSGEFSILGQDASTGLSWKLSNDMVLGLKTVNAAGFEVVEKSYHISELDRNDLTLLSSQGQSMVFEKSRKDVYEITGTLMYRERIALPPLVKKRVEVFADGELIAVSSLPRQNNEGLSFQVLILEPNQKKNITIEASLYYGFHKLFATKEAIAISKENIVEVDAKKERASTDKAQGVMVPLVKSEAYEGAPHMVFPPVAYVSANKKYSLFLEADGFGILKKDGKAQSVHWHLVDRNHTIEVLRTAQEPLFVSIASQNELTIQHIDGYSSLRLIKDNDLFKQESLMMTGRYVEMGNKGYFTDCDSQKEFVIDFAENPELHKAFMAADEKAGIASVEALISRQDGGIQMQTKNFKQFDSEMKCEDNFQNTGLGETYWRLIEMNEKPVEAYENQAEPHMIIKDNQAVGSDGCNNYFIPVSIENEKIDFGQGGSTLKMCPKGEEQAREYLRSLETIKTWDIQGSMLNLSDENGKKLRFEAVYF